MPGHIHTNAILIAVRRLWYDLCHARVWASDLSKSINYDENILKEIQLGNSPRQLHDFSPNDIAICSV